MEIVASGVRSRLEGFPCGIVTLLCTRLWWEVVTDVEIIKIEIVAAGETGMRRYDFPKVKSSRGWRKAL